MDYIHGGYYDVYFVFDCGRNIGVNVSYITAENKYFDTETRVKVDANASKGDHDVSDKK